MAARPSGSPGPDRPVVRRRLPEARQAHAIIHRLQPRSLWLVTARL